MVYMITRKAKLGKRIDHDILRILEGSEGPLTTRDLALKVGRAWHSVQTHCLRMQLKGEIKGFMIGTINVWEKTN